MFSTNSLHTHRAFTLVELMIVISIIGILAAALFPSLTGYLSRGRDTKRVADLTRLAGALEVYRNDNGAYSNAIHCPALGILPTRANCISAAWWDCWGAPDQMTATALSQCGEVPRRRLIPESYIPVMPQDVWASRGDAGDACSRPSKSSIYGYASEDTAVGYVLTARMENPPNSSKSEYYSGMVIGCTGYANWAIIVGNGGVPNGSGTVGR